MNTRSKKNRSKKKQKGGQTLTILPAPAPARVVCPPVAASIIPPITCPGPAPAASTADTYDIIIIAGQSNAIGRGTRNHNPISSTTSLTPGLNDLADVNDPLGDSRRLSYSKNIPV